MALSPIRVGRNWKITRTTGARTFARRGFVGPTGAPGAAGDTGATGPAGPNTVTTSTTTNLTGYLKGNGSNVGVQATPIPAADLPIASAGSLGAVRVGSNLSIDVDGILSGAAAVSSAALDSAFGSTRGSILRRGASDWELLTPGTSGHAVVSQGSGADPIYAAPMSIGGTITNGTANRVLYVGAGPVLAESANLTFDGNILTVKEIRLPSQVPSATTNPLVIDSVVSGSYTEPVFRLYVNGFSARGLAFRSNGVLQLSEGLALGLSGDFGIGGTGGEYYKIRRSGNQFFELGDIGAEPDSSTFIFSGATLAGCNTVFKLNTSTTNRTVAHEVINWWNSTDATRKGQVITHVFDTASRRTHRDFANGSNGYIALNVPSSAPADNELQNSELAFYTDGSGNLVIKLKDSSGTVRTGTVTLS